MQDEGDDGRADPIKDCRYCRQVAEVHIERAQRCHDHEIGKDERPAAGPRSPEAGAQIRDVNANLDREGAGQGLTDGDCFAHLFFREPLALGHELALHLADQRNRASEPKQSEPQKVRHDLSETAPRWCCGVCHCKSPLPDMIRMRNRFATREWAPVPLSSERASYGSLPAGFGTTCREHRT